jgi:DNA repair protein SbcC/Rad50
VVPLTLRLRNFMSYGAEPVEVDFAGLHLACLAGGNGNGKSALLDAITWALWGRSRARREDDLVRQGATEMEVEICFGAGAGRYRVLRKRTLRRSGGTAALELQAMGDGAYRSITGCTIAETQARLNEILKLGYDTFINSSFLLQGRADEFTVKPPAQRKAVLAEILGLDHYDRLAERAREHSRALDTKAKSLRDAMAAVESELARRPDLQKELADKLREREGAELALREAEANLKLAQAERQRLAMQEQDLMRTEQDIAALREEIGTLLRRHDVAEQTVREADELLAHEVSIMAGVDELRRVRAEVEEMGARAGRAMALQREAAVIHQEIEREAAELRGTLSSAASEETRQAAIAKQEPTLRRQVEEHEIAEARIPTVEAERAALAAEVRTVHDEVATLESDTKRLKAEMDPLRDRLKLLKESGAACPVCGAPMGEKERDRVYKQFEQEGLAKKERCAQNEARIAALRRRAAELEERDKALASTLAGHHKLARERGRLRELLRGAAAAAQAACEARTRWEAAHLALEREDFAHEARERLLAAEEAVRAVGYDPDRHAELRQRAEELAPMEAAAAELATARERRTAAAAAMAGVREDLARREAALRRAEESAAGLRIVLQSVPEAQARLVACEEAVSDSRERVKGLDERSVRLTERLHLLDEQEERLREKRTELVAIEREGGAYAELGRIFGKTGIQAMIIDNALPELESSANAILHRMSDGAMQVQFATQAQGAKGDLLETLDIRIADASGTRPYEMFSGGEAFRVNFAIRIALSRLLAERAGAQLQMLVIDEGFGTQDGQGRERLIEAINCIAADFEKIVVITHIDELKDLFNVRLDVIKGRDGSRVLVTTD